MHYPTSSNASSLQADAPRTGFSLIEMLIVMGVIVTLMGVLLVVVKQIRDASAKTATSALVQRVKVAMDTYLMEKACLPPIAAGDLLSTHASAGSAPLTLDLLAGVGLQWNGEHLCDPEVASPRYLQDRWGRPIHYAADQVIGGAMVINRPLAAADWNGRDSVPFAYIWSIGAPTRNGDVWDADPTTNARGWIYPRSQ